MKNVLKTSITIVFFSILLTACSGAEKKRNADFLPPIKIEIADEIKEDKALVDMIQSSEKAINEFSDNMEQLAIDGKDFLSKKEGEQSLMDGLKAGKLMIEFASNSTQMVASMEKFESYVTSQKEQKMINDAQLKALEKVGTAFKERVDQISKKYEHYFDQ